MEYIILAICIVIFVASLVFYKSTKKQPDEIVDKYQDANTRFLKAVEFRDNPERVVGFYEIDQVTDLAVTEDYTILKALCMELVEKGFNVSEYAIIESPMEIPCATVHVFSKVDEDKIGSISIFPSSNLNKKKLEDYFEELHEENKNHDSYLHHLILRLPGLVIESATSLKESIRPPVWMFFCAQVLTKYKPMYIDPSWINEHLEAKRYINTLFEDEE